MTARRDLMLWRRFASSRDPALREQLVARYLPLARYAARQYTRSHEPFDDMLQVASLGLLKAIDRYDPDHGAAFSSYALPTITGELRRHLRDRSWAVRPPRGLQEDALAVDKAAASLERTLSRSPTVTELALETGLDAESVLEAREALSARSYASLSAPTSSADSDGEGDTLLDRRHGIEETGYVGAEDRATLAPLFARLPTRDRTILRLRFEEDLTQAEIGEVVGLSQMQVSRVIRNSLAQMRLHATATA